MSKLRKQLLFLSLIASLPLTGCSNTKEEVSQNGIITVCDTHYNPEENSHRVDDLLGLDSTSDKDFYNENINYTYLIDNTNLTEEEFNKIYEEAQVNDPIYYASFARLVDENTITSKIDLSDGKTAMSIGTFNALQIIICPDSLKEDTIPYRCTEYEINSKKLVTMNGQTIYDIKSTMKFNDNIDRYQNHLNAGDVIECECVYQLKDGKFIELSRNQTGVGSEDENIVNRNFNNESKVVLKVEETPFSTMDGIYKKSYLYEALDAYMDKDLYYSPVNKDIDFSQYKKTLTNNEQ